MPTGLCGAGSPGFRLGRVESPMRTTVVFGPARPGTPVGHAQTSWSTTARPEILAGSPLGERGSPGVEPHCKSEGAGFSGPYRLCRICSPLSPRPQVGESVLLKAARVAGVNKSGTASPATWPRRPSKFPRGARRGAAAPRLPEVEPGSRGGGAGPSLPRAGAGHFGVEPGWFGLPMGSPAPPQNARLHPWGAAAPLGEPGSPPRGAGQNSG